MTPKPAYKRPIEHKERTYYFYNYSNKENGLKIYVANKKIGEKENRIILVDKCGETIGEGYFRDFRSYMG